MKAGRVSAHSLLSRDILYGSATAGLSDQCMVWTDVAHFAQRQSPLGTSRDVYHSLRMFVRLSSLLFHFITDWRLSRLSIAR
jgi:hypothetical protein